MSTATPEIAAPGVYEMTNDEYHADPVPGGSLSCSGARKLLPPNCPALFHYERQHPPASKRVYEFGHAAHDAVLGKGPEIVRCDFSDWRTNKAKAMAEEARERGAVPLLTEEYRRVQEMAEALRLHPIASALLQPGAGVAETSLFWTDQGSGVNCRARLDWLPNPTDGRLIIADYKTSNTANPDLFAKSAANCGYHQQHPWYVDAVTAVGLADDPQFVFVVQEKEPPYLVSVVQLDAAAVRIGGRLNRQAIDIYAECDSTGHWPGYTDDVALVSLPGWYERRYEN